MENLLNLFLLVTAVAMSFPLALTAARFSLRVLFRAMWVRSRSKVR
jgi:hypothetical protein